jgi:hemerythrin superfamily protein
MKKEEKMSHIFETLKEEHQEVKNMFAELMKSDEPNMELLDELNTVLDAHMKGEEKYVYPETKSIEAEQTLESYEEHHVAKLIQRELEKMSGEEENFMAKLKVFKEVVEHHIQEEENHLFPQTQNSINEDKQDMMEQKYMKLKSKSMPK